MQTSKIKKSPLTALIADDEPLARSRMRHLLQSDTMATSIQVLTQEAHCGAEVLALVEQLHPDILFLDVHMPDVTGIALAEQLNTYKQAPTIVYCTAYEHYAVDAFRVGATHYLLKPIQVKQLKEAVDRILQSASTPDHAALKNITLKIPSLKGAEYINSATIFYLQAEEKYTRVHHSGGSSLISDSLKTLQKQLPDTFVRIHRKTLISLPAVHILNKSTDNLWYVSLHHTEEKFVVSRRCLASLKQKLAMQSHPSTPIN